MAKVGSVVKLTAITAPTLSAYELRVGKVAFTDSSETVQRLVQLNATDEVETTDAAGVQGRYYDNTSVKQLDDADISASANIRGTKLADSTVGPNNLTLLSLGTFANANARFSLRTRS